MNTTIKFDTTKKHYVLEYQADLRLSGIFLQGGRIVEDLRAFGPESTEAQLMLEAADLLPPGEHVIDFHPIRGVNGKVVVTSRHKHAQPATV